jgi:hypothetical protein
MTTTVHKVRDLKIPYDEGEDTWGALDSAEAPFRIAVELGAEPDEWLYEFPVPTKSVPTPAKRAVGE